MLSAQSLRLVLSQQARAVVPIATGDTSMEPHLSGGDVVEAAVAPATPRPGDLLIFAQRDYLVLHRYLGTARTPDGEPCLRTRGDGRNELDPPVAAGAVVARAVAVRRAGVWRSLEGPGPSLYARLVAWHALAWAAAGIAARKVGLGGVVRSLDGALLGVASRLFFVPMHGRIAAPPATRSENSV